MRSRLLTMAAVLSVAAAGLAACSPSDGTGDGGTSGGNDSGGGNVELEFQTGLAVDSDILVALTEITDAFYAENPDITIDLVPRSNTYESDITVRLAAGDAPDLWATHGWSLLRYSEFLEPLQDEPWAQYVNPALDEAMRNSDGEFFAYPADTDIAGIVYNVDVLSDAGIDPASLTTWDAFNDALATLKEDGITPITASGKDNWFAGNLADWMLSGAYTDDQQQQLVDGTFVEDGYATVLDQFAQWREAGLFNVDYSSATTDDIAQALGTGTTGFVFIQNSLTTNALQFNPDANLGFMPVPSFVGDTGYLIGGEGQAFGISSDAVDVDAAKAYLAFLAEPENTTALAAAAGNAPGLTNATADLGHLQSSYDEFVAPGDFPLVPYFDRVYLPNGMWNTVVTTADSLITGQSDVDSAISQLQTDFDSLYGQATE